MKIQYISITTNEILEEIKTEDLVGILAASKDGSIAFIDGVRKYDSHMLCLYRNRDGESKQYLKIFVK